MPAKRAPSQILEVDDLESGLTVRIHCARGSGPRQGVIVGRRTQTHVLTVFPGTEDDEKAVQMPTTEGRQLWAVPEWVPLDRELRDMPLTKWPALRSTFAFEEEETFTHDGLAEVTLRSPGRRGGSSAGRLDRSDPMESGELEARFGRLEATMSRVAAAVEARSNEPQQPMRSGDAQDAGLIERARRALAMTGERSAPLKTQPYKETAGLFAAAQPAPPDVERFRIGTPDRDDEALGAELRRLAATGMDEEAMGAALRRHIEENETYTQARPDPELLDSLLRGLAHAARHAPDGRDDEEHEPGDRATRGAVRGAVSAIQKYEEAKANARSRGRERWANLVRRLHQRVAPEGAIRTRLWTYFDRYTDLRRQRQMITMVNVLLEIPEGVETNSKDQVLHGLTAGLLYADQFCWDNGKVTTAQRVSLLGHPEVQYDRDAKQRPRVLDQPYAPLVNAELVGLATGAGKALRSLANDIKDQE